jgi:hypothetical protein
MSDDHYIAQTYLKHFVDANKPGFVHVSAIIHPLL